MSAPADFTWVVDGQACAHVAALKEEWGEAAYREQRDAFKEWLCNYIDNTECRTKGAGVSPLHGYGEGGMVLKARWGTPGSGKRGGLRVLLVAYLEQRRIVIAGIWPRVDDPSDADIASALRQL